VDRGLRVDIAKAEAAIVLVNDVARNFAIGDLLEDGFVGHGGGDLRVQILDPDPRSEISNLKSEMEKLPYRSMVK
jgi:hypothetical protein